MPRPHLSRLVGAVLRPPARDPRPDAELLTCFLDDGDETAFESLVLRHTAAVRAACRGWLRAEADIDDAAQATFLVLARRAGSIRRRAALGGFLYRVAVNVARRLRRRQKAHRPLPDDLPARPVPADDGLSELLAEEIARLPEKYRLPVQLCYAAGLTTAEAASRLGWPRGTVLTRLTWARRRLQKVLTRRGVAPAVVTAALAGMSAPPVNGEWARRTAAAARALRDGQPSTAIGVSGQTLSLTEGVIRAMLYDRLKYLALAALLAVGLAGFGIGHWASASNGKRGDDGPAADARGVQPPAGRDRAPGGERAAPEGEDAAKKEARPAAGRRREAVIRLPAGTYTKEVEAAPYGSGRLTWTYEDDRVLGLIEVSVMGFELELATEAEYALSSNGTIYGLLTGARINHLRVPDDKDFAEFKPFAGLWPVFEPLLNDVLIDLPFSYRFRVQGDRLVLSDFRILLAGPNPLGKLGGLGLAKGSGNSDAAMLLSAFQGLGTALEGTYTAPGDKDRAPPKKQPLFRKSRSPGGAASFSPTRWGGGRPNGVSGAVTPAVPVVPSVANGPTGLPSQPHVSPPPNGLPPMPAAP